MENVEASDHVLEILENFGKGLADRGGWREEILPMPRGSDLLAAELFICPFRRRGNTILGMFSLAVFWALSGAKPLPPTPFRNL